MKPGNISTKRIIFEYPGGEGGQWTEKFFLHLILIISVSNFVKCVGCVRNSVYQYPVHTMYNCTMNCLHFK